MSSGAPAPLEAGAREADAGVAGRVRLATEIPGPASRALVARERRRLAPGLQSFALHSGIALAVGRGRHVVDVDGNTYLDFIGGIGVGALGHAHPEWVAAVRAQAERLSVGSFTSEPRVDLLEELEGLVPRELTRLQLYSSGAEAVESALRLARCRTGRQDIVGFWGGFHGKTAGAMALMGSAAKHGLGPFPPGVQLIPYANCYRCPFGLERASCGLACATFARKAIKQTSGPLAAVIVEPMQGTAGNVIPPPEFLAAVRDAAHEAGALLIADEMITGFGRTGRPFASERSSVAPDIMTVGKAFGGGFPVAGVLAREEIAGAKPWSDPSGASSSYGGNPLAAAAALATVRILKRERLWENAARVGASLLRRLEPLGERYPFVGEVRGEGMFLAIEMVKDRATREPLSAEVMRGVFDACLRRGLLAMGYAPTIRLQPALNLTDGEAAEGVAILDEVFAELLHSGRWRG